MTLPTDPQATPPADAGAVPVQAAIDRLRATARALVAKDYTVIAAMMFGYGEHFYYADAAKAFAADIETLTNLTQVGWGCGYTITGTKTRGVDLREIAEVKELVVRNNEAWFPVYARVPS